MSALVENESDIKLTPAVVVDLGSPKCQIPLDGKFVLITTPLCHFGLDCLLRLLSRASELSN